MKTKIKNNIKSLTIIVLAILVSISTASAIGTLTPSGTAGDDTQYTLNDIYTKLTTGATTTEGTSTMSVPGTVSASFRTLTEIYDAIPTIDPTKVATGTSYLGVEGTLEKGLPKTGQTICYTGNSAATTTCPGIYDDGGSSSGIALSYTDNGNGTVTDNVTGLIWQQSGAYQAPSWEGAITYCNNLTLGGSSDWRLPNIKELQSIVDYGRASPSINPVFTNSQSDSYWSGTTYHDYTNDAWSVNFYGGSVNGYDKPNENYYARCVR